MAGAGYYAVEKGIRDAITADPDLSGVRVFIERDLVWAAESAPAVCIYLTRRKAPPGEQRLSGGRRTDWILEGSLWCYEWHLDDTERAAELRDSLMERVETATMRDRTFGDICETSWLDGGEFISGPADQGFLCAGEVALQIKVFSTV